MIIFQRLLKNASDEQKLTFGAGAAVTDNFLHEAAARTVLTPTEMNFLAFQAWREFLNEGGDAIILGIIKDHLQPLRSEPQEHNRVRFWAKVPELGDRVLRVVTLEDKLTIHNAFLDRGFKP